MASQAGSLFGQDWICKGGYMAASRRSPAPWPKETDRTPQAPFQQHRRTADKELRAFNYRRGRQLPWALGAHPAQPLRRRAGEGAGAATIGRGY